MDLEKGVDEFESGAAKARHKIEAIGEQTKEQYQNWKRALSGALNDKQLIIALSLLFGFYLFFSGFNTILGGNAREENTITCACPSGHSAYYRTLVIATIALWVVCFILTMVWDAYKFWRYVVSKSSSQHHHQTHTDWSRGDIEDAKDRASSMLEKAVEAGAQATSKIPVQSIFTKAMGVVEGTMNMVDEGAKTLHKIDRGLKENPLEHTLTKSMSVIDGVVTHRLDESASSKSKESETNKLPTATESLIEQGAEVVDTVKQDPTLEAKQSSVGPLLKKSMSFVEDGMQAMSRNPAGIMVSKTMDFVDDMAQINCAELIAKSKGLVDTVRQNPIEPLLAGSMNMIGNAVANEIFEGTSVIQSTGHNSEDIHDVESLPASSMLSTAMEMVNTGLQAVKQDTDELALSEVTKFAEVTHDNPMMDKTVGLVASTASSECHAKSLLQDTVEMAKQNPAIAAKTMTSLNNELLVPDGSLLSTAVGLVDSGAQLMPQNSENLIPAKATGDDSYANMLSKSAGLATNVMSGQGFNELQKIGEDPQSVLANAKILGKTKLKKSHAKRAFKLPHSQQLSQSDTNALLRLKHYEDYLWLQFYKVYSVGATLQGEDESLPSFIHVVGGDHTEPNGYETSAEDEIKSLIEETDQNKHNYSETELVEMQNSCDDGDEIPAIVIETDFPGVNYKMEEDNVNELPITNEPDMADDEISDTTSYCNAEDHDTFDTTAANNNDQTTSHHDTNLTTSNWDVAPATSHPLAQAKLTQSNNSLLSVKSNSTLPKSLNSASLSIKSNTTDDEDLLEFWMHLKPVGLYNESIDEENMVMQVADATCARVSFFLYPLLVLCRLLSQLILVPLLLFQILDTYSWICITDDIYCSSILNQYRLGLDKAALAFTFYCCLLASILATAILRWFPCSKYARKAGATCIM